MLSQTGCSCATVTTWMSAQAGPLRCYIRAAKWRMRHELLSPPIQHHMQKHQEIQGAQKKLLAIVWYTTAIETPAVCIGEFEGGNNYSNPKPPMQTHDLARPLLSFCTTEFDVAEPTHSHLTHPEPCQADTISAYRLPLPCACSQTRKIHQE